MKTATVRQLRNAFPEVLREVRNGETVVITSRRKVVATLGPPLPAERAKRSKPWANLRVRMAELQQQPMLAVSGAELLAAERERF